MLWLAIGTMVTVNIRSLVLLNANTAVGEKQQSIHHSVKVYIHVLQRHIYMYVYELVNYLRPVHS